MKNKEGKIFKRTKCPPEGMLEAYHMGKLSEIDKRNIEAHIIDCPMCSDELEGLEQFASNEKHQNAVDDIQSRINSKYGFLNKAPSYYLYIGGIAATILIAIISGYLIVGVIQKSNKNQIAQNLEQQIDKKEQQKQDSTKLLKPVANAVQDITDELKLIETPMSVIGKSTTHGQEKNKAQTDTIKSIQSEPTLMEEKKKVVEIIENEIDIEDNAMAEGISINYEAEAEETENIRTKTSVQSMDQKSKAVQPVAFMAMESEQQKKIVPNDAEIFAVRSFQEGNYENCYTLLNELVQKKGTNDTLIYYLSVSCVELNKNQEAIHYFSQIQSSEYELYSRKWFLSKAYIQSDSIEKAIVLLKELSLPESPYREDAQKSLTRLTKN